MSRTPLTIEELRELRSVVQQMIETHDFVLEQLGYGTGWSGRESVGANRLIQEINRLIGELS